jgi:hypothetical protein
MYVWCCLNSLALFSLARQPLILALWRQRMKKVLMANLFRVIWVFFAWPRMDTICSGKIGHCSMAICAVPGTTYLTVRSVFVLLYITLFSLGLSILSSKNVLSCTFDDSYTLSLFTLFPITCVLSTLCYSFVCLLPPLWCPWQPCKKCDCLHIGQFTVVTAVDNLTGSSCQEPH